MQGVVPVARDFDATVEGMAQAQAFLELYQEDPKPAIIMDEIVSNIIRYSGASRFSIAFETQDGKVSRMTFSDDGRAFDPTREIVNPDVNAPLEDREAGGLGMFMVRKMSKSVSYARENDRNVLTVLFAF